MKTTIGRIVEYTLNQEDADQINRRRTNGYEIADKIKEGKWSIGAQAHIGNKAEAGQKFPMIIVAVWSENCVNGQVFLDGTDVLWKTSTNNADTIADDNKQGMWNWTVIAK
jgi:hypothetical protein